MKIYLVGGAVRDQLLSHPYHEKDWVVVGSSPEEMMSLGYTPVGKDFPVFLHPKNHEEYALARTERKTAPGYKGFTFHTDKNISLEEDLERRDLTINAMAQTDDGHIIDPHHGQADIQEKKLRHVSSAFCEDPVRILRVARFSARYAYLNFSVANETMILMQDMVAQGETQHLVPERVWQECHKALSEQHPDIFFTTLAACHALNDVFPCFHQQDLTPCLTTLRATQNINSHSVIRFSAFCHPLPLEQIEALCLHLATPNDYKELAVMCHKFYDCATQTNEWTPQTLSVLFQKTDALRKPERFQQWLTAIKCIYSAHNNIELFIADTLLNDALQAYKNVNHQALIEQGYQKAALGQAIKEKRVAILQEWLTANAIK